MNHMKNSTNNYFICANFALDLFISTRFPFPEEHRGSPPYTPNPTWNLWSFVEPSLNTSKGI